jgi:hypothetical protein
MTKQSRVYLGLLDAAYALTEQASGGVPELSRLLSGALTLDLLARQKVLSGGFDEAADNLTRAVTKGEVYLDTAARERASDAAKELRNLASKYK